MRHEAAINRLTKEIAELQTKLAEIEKRLDAQTKKAKNGTK